MVGYMTSRPLPPTGGGPPVIAAAGTVLPSTSRGPQPALTLTLTVSADAEEAGLAVVALAREACLRTDLDEVATLRFFFQSVTERVPEFHALMDELVSAGDTASIERIMRAPGSPGRPRGRMTPVALIEQIMSEHPGWSAKQAAQWLVENLRGKTPIWIPGLKRLQNLHSELKHVFALWHRPLYVRPELLTAEAWLPPGREPWWVDFFATAVVTRLPSGTVVMHSPDDTVTQGASHVEAENHAQQPLESTESEQPGLPQQPARPRDQ